MVGRYRFEFILIILILCALIAARFIFPDCSYLILLPTFIPSRL